MGHMLGFFRAKYTAQALFVYSLPLRCGLQAYYLARFKMHAFSKLCRKIFIIFNQKVEVSF